DSAAGGFEVQEYRKPEFEVRVTPATHFIVQDDEVKGTINARYYFGQPVAGGRIAWVAHRQPSYSPYPRAGGEDPAYDWTDEGEEGGGRYWYGEEEALEGSARLDANGTAEISVPVALDEHGNDYSLRIEARVTDASSREVSGATVVNATYGAFLLAANL